MFYKKIHKNEQEKKNSTTEKTRIIEAKVGERWQRRDREERKRERENGSGHK